MIKTVSKDLAIKLKEAGFPQDNCSNYWIGDEENHGRFNLGNYDASKTMDSYAAPTAEEILEQLPNRVKGKQLTITKYTGKLKYVIEYEDGMFEATLAEAAGKMYLYLKQNNLL